MNKKNERYPYLADKIKFEQSAQGLGVFACAFFGFLSAVCTYKVLTGNVDNLLEDILNLSPLAVVNSIIAGGLRENYKEIRDLKEEYKNRTRNYERLEDALDE